ncbi:hypothetical protein EON63_05575 [archaeon]|nr:MAG: hypothetical protein EON63_05575 [archaeon]
MRIATAYDRLNSAYLQHALCSVYILSLPHAFQPHSSGRHHALLGVCLHRYCKECFTYLHSISKTEGGFGNC